LPAEPPTLFALSIPDIVAGDKLFELMVKSSVEMLSTRERMIVVWVRAKNALKGCGTEM
jgi:hypothetical protein